MEVSTKELRIQPGKIIDQVVNGQEITVTYRGKALAKIIPLKNRIQSLKMMKLPFSVFGKIIINLILSKNMYAIFEKGVNFDYRYRRSYLVSSR